VLQSPDLRGRIIIGLLQPVGCTFQPGRSYSVKEQSHFGGPDLRRCLEDFRSCISLSHLAFGAIYSHSINLIYVFPDLNISCIEILT
jgi:hypothetical protein